MNGYTAYDKEDRRDSLKSAIITAVVWAAVLLFIFLYKVTEIIPEKNEVVAEMLINFGDNQNGNGEEEPANQDGSIAATTETPAPTPEPVSVPMPEPERTQPSEPEKIITGTNEKKTVITPKADKLTKAAEKTNNTKKTNSTASAKSIKTNAAKSTTSNAKTGNGDGKGTAAIGNLIKGRGTKTGIQGANGTNGNSGDPLGGDSNGNSKIGVDRNLIAYIPGTMGRGGVQPSHNCTAAGSISISYTVDKAGNVISARRSGGISDPCVVSTSVSWVKKYVKAEKSSFSSSGVYRITF